MATELRWILLTLSVLLLGGIWWWGARRARQSPLNTEWRESPVPAQATGADEPPVVRAEEQSREWGVPPFEPLSIRTADFDPVEVMHLPMTTDYPGHPADADPDFDLGSRSAGGMEPEIGFEIDDVLERPDFREPTLGLIPPPPESAEPSQRSEPSEPSEPESKAGPLAAEVPPVPESQRIVTIRVSAPDEARWSGTDLMAALEKHGLGYGRYKVFHRKHNDGRTLFCAASLVEPGTFDLARMPQEEFRGLTLFAVLPGPAEPLQAIDALIATAGDLAETLSGSVQDANGAPMTPQRAEALREDVARFQEGVHGRAGQAG